MMNGKHLRTIVALATVAIITVSAIGLAGCKGDKSGMSPERAKTLIVALPGDVNSLDHDKNSGLSRTMDINILDWQWIKLGATMVNGQLTADRTQMEAGIVKSWETQKLPDGRVKQIFHLRKGVMFHTGHEVTAHDLAWAMERRMGTKGDYVHIFLGAMYTGAELAASLNIPDPYTLEVTCKQDMPYFWDIWAQRVYFDADYVKSKAAADDPWGLKVVSKEDVGSGPYKVTTWTSGVEMVLERFGDYFGDKPYFDKIIFKVVPDLSARIMMLETAEVDMAMGIPAKEMDALVGKPGIKVVTGAGMTQVFVTIKADVAPFDDVKVRQALSYAFPYDDVLTSVYGGQAQEMNGPVPTGLQGALAQRPFSTDLEKARQLLTEAGKTNLNLTLAYCADYPEHEKIGLLFQASLAKIGVTCQLQQLPVGEFEKQAREKTIPFAVRSGLGYIWDPAYMLQMWFLGESFINIQGYKNPTVDQMIYDMLRETDPAKRAALVTQAQDIIVADVPSIYVAQPNFRQAMRDDIQGYVYQNTEYSHLWELRRDR